MGQAELKTMPHFKDWPSLLRAANAMCLLLCTCPFLIFTVFYSFEES